MNRIIKCFLQITVLLLLVSSCTAEPTDTTATPSSAASDNPVAIKDNYWNLACANTNVVLYKNLNGSRSIQFELVSAFPFDVDELSLQLESDAPNISYTAECFMEGYTALCEQNKLPILYRYVVGIGFHLDKLYSVERVNAINVQLNGETKRYVMDNLILDGEREFNLKNAGISTTLAISDAPVNISKDGTLDLTCIDLQAPKSYQLTGLSLLDDDTTRITDCSITLKKPDGTQIDMKWDGLTPIQVMSGESVRIDAKCIDTRLAWVMASVISKYIQIHYVTSDGDECTEIVQGIYRMRQGLYDLDTAY